MKKEKTIYNMINIGGLKIESTNTSLESMEQVADRILQKHKKVLKHRQMPTFSLENDYFG